MKIPGRQVVLALPLLLAAAPAGATASLTCSAKDQSVSFELFGNIGSGDGAAAQITEGEIKLKLVKGKFGSAEFKIEPGSMAGSWSFGNELRIGVQSDKIGDLSVFLAVFGEKTRGKSDDATKWRGHYVLKISGPKGETEIKGRMKGCEAS